MVCCQRVQDCISEMQNVDAKLNEKIAVLTAKRDKYKYENKNKTYYIAKRGYPSNYCLRSVVVQVNPLVLWKSAVSFNKELFPMWHKCVSVFQQFYVLAFDNTEHNSK